MISELEVFSSDFEQDLAAYETPNPTPSSMRNWRKCARGSRSKVALLRFRGVSEKIEVVRVFDDLLSKIGL